MTGEVLDRILPGRKIGISHFGISCLDFDRMLDFYTRVIGLTIADQGLPVTVKRVEDVGRHRIVRAEFQGAPLSAILPEGAPVPADPRAAFAPGKINVYANDWRVAPMGG